MSNEARQAYHALIGVKHWDSFLAGWKLNPGGKQSRKASALEAFLNTLSGFIISTLLSWAASPLWGIQFTFVQSLSWVFMFTVVSMIRSYFWRRYFNHKQR